MASGRAEGDFMPDYNEEQHKAFYDGANKVTEGTDGVTLADIIVAKRAAGKIIKEKKA